MTTLPDQTSPRSVATDFNFTKPSHLALAVDDLREGLGKVWLWGTLALNDIKLRYRGSMLGPFWITISTAVTAIMMGGIYSHILKTEQSIYLPYLVVSLVFWQFLATLLNESCDTFLLVEKVIQQVKIPFSVFVYRTVLRNFITLAHSAILIPIILILFPRHWGFQIFLFPLALIVLAMNGVWISTVLGMLSTRFRDVPPIVSSLVQLMFFTTPIFWDISTLGEWKHVARYNPFFAALDILRAPLLGYPVEPTSWPVMLALTAFGSLATFTLFVRFRGRLAYWV